MSPKQRSSDDYQPTAVRRDVQTLLQVAETLNSGRGFTHELGRVLEIVTDALDAGAATLCVPEQEGGRGELRVSFAARGHEMKTELLDVELGLRDEVLRGGASLAITDVRQEPRFRDGVERAFGLEPRAVLAVPLRRRHEVVGLLVAVREKPRAFDRDDQDLLEAIADKVAVAVENDSLMRQLRRDLQVHELLLDVSREVGRSLDLDRVLEQVFDSLNRVVPFDAAAIFLVAPEDQSLRVAAQRGYSDEGANLEVPAGKGIISLVLEELRGTRVADVRKHPRYLAARPGTRSEIAIPIVSGGEAIGVVNLESDRSDAYTESDLRIAELIAAHVASAIINAQRHRDRLERSQIEHEMALARDIQLRLFPGGPPASGTIEWDALNVPSSAVGGDYYDHMLTDDNRLWLLIADVSGHGLSAALLTASMQTGFRLLARDVSDPGELAGRLNEVLFESSPANQFVAAIITILDLESGELRFCNAGHLPAVVIGDRAISELRGGGLPLGMFGTSEYETVSMRVDPHDLIVFYTDGIPEATDLYENQFGIKAVLEIARQHREAEITEIIPAIRLAVRSHRGRTGGHLDDITLMVARWRGPEIPISA